MKEFLDKILGSKYIGNIAMAIVAIILIIVGYLIYAQYQSSKDVSIYGNEVEVYNYQDETKENKKEEVKDDKKEQESKPEVTPAEKVQFVDSLDVITKGKNVGKAIKKDKTTGDIYSSVSAFLNNKDKLKITTDTVVSLSLSTLNNTTKSSINAINAKIFNEKGETIFNNNISLKYDKITLAVDELTESSVYYAVVTITLKDSTSVEYVFKF